MNYSLYARQQFEDCIALLQNHRDQLSTALANGAQSLANSLLNDGKILVAGQAGANALAQYFATLMIDRFESERPSLPALALSGDSTIVTTFAAEHRIEELYANQVMALGQSGDILLLLHAPGSPTFMGQSVQAAHQRDMTCVLLGGTINDDTRNLLQDNDIIICIDSDSTARILEIQLVLIHGLCELIDRHLLGPN